MEPILYTPPCYPGRENLNVEPPVFLIPNFLSLSECETLIEKAKGNLRPSRVREKGTGTLIKHPGRTSESCSFGYELQWLISRVEKATGLPRTHQEPAQITRYKKGQFYRAHHDFLRTPDGKPGQRLVTFLIYLNEVRRGGCTFFKNLNLRVKPEIGSAVIFFPSGIDEKGDERYLHEAEMTEDEKWVTQIWVRSRPYSSRV